VRTNDGWISRLRGRRRAFTAGIATIATLAVMGVTAPAALAFPESGYLMTCDPRGSADVCWWNYSDAHTLDDIRTQTQYNRDQVCAKARHNYTTGPVAEGSACWAGVNYTYAQFDGTHQLKKGYGYWAGNGSGIWVRVRAHY
jgi:hypothetical protein